MGGVVVDVDVELWIRCVVGIWADGTIARKMTNGDGKCFGKEIVSWAWVEEAVGCRFGKEGRGEGNEKEERDIPMSICPSVHQILKAKRCVGEN